VTDKRCTICGVLNAANANFCSACGTKDCFVEVPAEQLPEVSQAPRAVLDSNALRFSVTRLVVLSAVTSGLYFFYWLYSTWKQLQDETGDVYYPVWHALSLIVPVYGLFRLHKHMRVIQNLNERAGIESSLTPGLVVVLIALNWVLGFGTREAVGFAALVLTLIRFTLLTTVIVWAQVNLNSYWRSSRGDALRNVPMKSGEVVFIGVILFVQLSQFF
jgi:hypothetical protein